MSLNYGKKYPVAKSKKKNTDKTLEVIKAIMRHVYMQRTRYGKYLYHNSKTIITLRLFNLLNTSSKALSGMSLAFAYATNKRSWGLLSGLSPSNCRKICSLLVLHCSLVQLVRDILPLIFSTCHAGSVT